MGYVVLTAKHHDGFCLFDSALTDFKSTNTPFGRDAVAEFVEAVRAEGLKVGLYFSLIDWHHPDYPHYGDRYHPMRNDPAFENSQRDFDRYLDFMALLPALSAGLCPGTGGPQWEYAVLYDLSQCPDSAAGNSDSEPVHRHVCPPDPQPELPGGDSGAMAHRPA